MARSLADCLDIARQTKGAVNDYEKSLLDGWIKKDGLSEQYAVQKLIKMFEGERADILSQLPLGEAKALAKEEAQKPKQKPSPRGTKQQRQIEAIEARRTTYFTPGNIVRSYVGYDRVVSYDPGDPRAEYPQNHWSATVRQVEQKDGKWVEVPGSIPRKHMTEPTNREYATGPVESKPAIPIPKEAEATPAKEEAKPEPKGTGRAEVAGWHGGRELEGGRFKTEYIGTGEGAQAFGWGLYFTDLEEVGKYYAQLAIKTDTLRVKYGDAWNAVYNAIVGDKRLALQQIDNHIENQENYIKKWDVTEGKPTQYLDKLKEIKRQILNNEIKKERTLYRVTLHKGKKPGEYDWLNWHDDVPDRQLKKIEDQAQKEGFGSIVDFMGVAQTGIAGWTSEGETLYHGLSQLISQEQNKKAGGDVFRRSQKEASLFLLRAGIDGIRYPAGTLSSGAKEGTYNYVVFDENAVTIEETIQFSLAPSPAKGMSVKALDMLLTPVRKLFKGAPAIQVVQSHTDLPTAVKESDAYAGRSDKDRALIRGFTWTAPDGTPTVYLIGDAFNNGHEVIITAIHEIVGHLGLREALGTNYQTFLDQLYRAKENDLTMKWIRENYQEFDASTPEGKRGMADEWFARQVTEGKVAGIRGWWNRFVRIVREWARKVGFKVYLSEKEIKALMDKIKSGEPLTSAVIADVGRLARERMEREPVVKGIGAGGKALLGKVKAGEILSAGARLSTRIGKTEIPEDFRESAVKDADGTLIPVFHGTDAEFDEFQKTRDIGYHFGDKKAAQRRVKEVSKFYKKDPKTFHVDEYFLNIKNPLTVPDVKAWDDLTFWQVLKGRGVIGKDEALFDEMEKIRDIVREKVPIRWDEHFKEDTDRGLQVFAEEWRKYLQNRIKQAGYDGLMYSNVYEGGTSYIAFDDSQILRIPKGQARALFTGEKPPGEGWRKSGDHWVREPGKAGELTLWENIKQGQPVSFYAYRGTKGATTTLSPIWQKRFNREYLLGEGIYVTPSSKTASHFGEPESVKVSLENPFVIREANANSLLKLDIADIKANGHDGIVILKGQAGFGRGQESLVQAVIFPEFADKVIFEKKPTFTGILEKGAKVEITSVPEYFTRMHPEVTPGLQGVVSSMVFGEHPNVRIGNKTYSLSKHNVKLIGEQKPDLFSLAKQMEAQPGELIGIKKLREQTGLSKEEFDQQVLDLANQGKIALHHHVFPAEMTEAEKADTVTVPANKAIGETRPRYAVGFSIRPKGEARAEIRMDDPQAPKRSIKARQADARAVEAGHWKPSLIQRVFGGMNSDAWLKDYMRPDGTIDRLRLLNETGIDASQLDKNDMMAGISPVQGTQDLAFDHEEVRKLMEIEQEYIGGSNLMSVRDKDTLTPYMELSKESKQRIHEVAFAGDTEWEEYDETTLKKRFGLSDEEVKGYNALRDFYNGDLDYIVQHFLEQGMSRKREQELMEANGAASIKEVTEKVAGFVRDRNTGPGADKILNAVKQKRDALKEMNVLQENLKEALGLDEQQIKTIIAAYMAKAKTNREPTIDGLIRKAARAISKAQEDVKPDKLEKKLRRLGFEDYLDGMETHSRKFIDLAETMQDLGEAIKNEIDAKVGPNEKLTAQFEGLGLEETEIFGIVGKDGLADFALQQRGYVPHMFEGRWRVKVELRNGDEYLVPVPDSLLSRLGLTKHMRRGAAQRMAINLISERWKPNEIRRFVLVRATKLPLDMFEGVSSAAMHSILKSAHDETLRRYAKDKKSVSKEELEDLKQVFDAIEGQVKKDKLAKGWGRHLIHRTGVLGFRRDLDKVTSEYSSNFNHWYNKGIKAKKFGEAMQEIDPKVKPVMWKWAKQFISDMLGEAHEANSVKRLISGWFLAGDLSAAALNATGAWTHTVAMLRSIEPKTDKIIAERELFRAQKDVFIDYVAARKKGLDSIFKMEGGKIAAEIKDLRQMLEKGLLDPSYFGETTGLSGVNIYQDWWTSTQKWLYRMFTGTEAMNRISTAVAVIRRAKRAGITDPQKLAAYLVTETQGWYSRGARPEIVRKMGWTGSALYTFMTFPMFNIGYLKHRIQELAGAKNPHDAKVAAKVLATNLGYVAVFGGMQALPFMFVFKALMRMLMDPEDDPEYLVRKYAPAAWAGRAVSRGIPSVFGVDFSNAVQGTDIFGAPIGFQTLKSIAKKAYYNAYLPLKRGEEFHTLLMAAPDMLANPYKAFIAPGGTGFEGKPAVEYTAGERPLRALGFTPTREAEVRLVRDITHAKRERRLDKLDNFSERLLVAARQPDVEKRRSLMRELNQDVQDYNAEEREKGTEGLLIQWKEIRQMAQRRKKTREKGYGEREPKYMQRFQTGIAGTLGLEKRYEPERKLFQFTKKEAPKRLLDYGLK